MKKSSLLFGLLLLALNFSCDNDCMFVSIHDVYAQALIYPEEFDTWVSEHSGRFDEDFDECLDKLISLKYDIVNDEKAYCHQAYQDDLERFSICHNNAEAHFKDYYFLLLAIKKVVRGDTTLLKMDVGHRLIHDKDSKGATNYELEKEAAARAAEKHNICEDC